MAFTHFMQCTDCAPSVPVSNSIRDTIGSSIYYFFLFLCLALLSACSSPKGPNYAEGSIAGEWVGAEMDSEIAKYALASSEDEPFELKQQRQSLEQVIHGVPSEQQLQLLTQQGSTDFASVVYARAVLNQSGNLHWQTRSRELSGRLDSIVLKSRLQQVFSNYHALIVPGWNWESRPDTGADLAVPRSILASYGLQSTLVRTDENGRVEENGQRIADAIEEARKWNKPIILISASKGGADTSYALGALIDDQQTLYVKGWLNIGGIIAGSTLVDHALENPEDWLRHLGFDEDTETTAVESLNTEDSRRRLARLNFPKLLTIINYAGLPFASTLHPKARYSYTHLAAYGPNDGAALLPELLVPTGHTVLEIGLDHYMRSPRAMRRVIALLLMIMECETESVCQSSSI